MTPSLVPILIPAYQPSPVLTELVRKLETIGLTPILIVNDGSDSRCDPIFEELERFPHVTVLRHAINLGKGAALKTGINYALTKYPDLAGVITVDADGQHSPEDTQALKSRFLQNTNSLTLGVREFNQIKEVPWRSRFGNTLTRKVFRTLTGYELADTQTGLRAIPKNYLPQLLELSTNGYEFETDMLLLAIRSGIKLTQHPISTVYIDGNASSHFNPLFDSLKIYFVLIRFAMNSIMTSIIDFATFALSQYLGTSILTSSILGRAFSGIFNFITSKRFVFHSRGSVAKELIEYAALVSLMLFISNSSVSALVRRLGMNVYLAKLLVESSLFLLNFSIQKTFIFTQNRKKSSQTDWDSYYAKPFKATSVTRKITIGRIIDFLSPHKEQLINQYCVEFGGGNSCVYETLRENISFNAYRIMDTNALGVELFNKRAKAENDSGIIGNVLDLSLAPTDIKKNELCLSIGLIEHFDEVGTQKAIRSHFECASSNGLVLITYPTPTWLYRLTRGIAELLGLWKFHDERPLTRTEVVNEVEKYGKILRHETIWPIFLTQGIVLCRKSGSP